MIGGYNDSAVAGSMTILSESIVNAMDDSRILNESITSSTLTRSTMVTTGTVGEPSSPLAMLDRSVASSPPLSAASAVSSSLAVSSTLSLIANHSNNGSTSVPSTPSGGGISYTFEDGTVDDEQVASTLAPSPLSSPSLTSTTFDTCTGAFLTNSNGATGLLSGSYVSVTATDWEHRQAELAEQHRSLEAAKAGQFNANVQMIQQLASQLSAARVRHAHCDEQAVAHEEEIRVLHEQLSTQAVIAVDLTRKLETNKSDSAKVLVELSGVSQHLAECKRRVAKLQDDLRTVSSERALLSTQLRTGEMELTMIMRQRDRYLHRWHGSRATLRELRRVFRDELNRIATVLGMRGGEKDDKSSTSAATTSSSVGTAPIIDGVIVDNKSMAANESPESLHSQLQRLAMLAAELDSSLDDDSDLDNDHDHAIRTGSTRRVSPPHRRRKSHGDDGASRSKSRDRIKQQPLPTSGMVSHSQSPTSPSSPRSGDITPPMNPRSPVDYSPPFSDDDMMHGGNGNGGQYRSPPGSIFDESFIQLAARLGVDRFSDSDASDVSISSQHPLRGLPAPPHSSSRGRSRRWTEDDDGRSENIQSASTSSRSNRHPPAAALICCPPFVDLSYRRWQPLSKWCRLEWCAPLLPSGRRVAV